MGVMLDEVIGPRVNGAAGVYLKHVQTVLSGLKGVAILPGKEDEVRFDHALQGLMAAFMDGHETDGAYIESVVGALAHIVGMLVVQQDDPNVAWATFARMVEISAQEFRRDQMRVMRPRGSA